MSTTICPRCQQQRLPDRGALSRKDNETYICSSRGTDEAMLDLQGLDVWPQR